MPTKLSALHPIAIGPVFSAPLILHTLNHRFLAPPRTSILAGGQSRTLIPVVASSFSTHSGSGRIGDYACTKSLIDDEVDLTDWDIGLNPNRIMTTRVYSDVESGEGDKSGGPRSGEGAGKKRRGSEFDRVSDFTGRRGGGSRGSSEPFSGRRKNNDADGGLSRGRGRSHEFGSRRFNGGGRGRDSGGFRGNGKFVEKRESGGGDFLSRGKGKGNGDGQGGLWAKKGGMNDVDMGAEEEKRKGYTNFKELVNNDEDDDDDGDDEEEEVEEGDVVIKKGEALAKLDLTSAGSSDSHLSNSRFDKCPISPLSLKAIKDAGFERMTMVQEATLDVILKGKDVLAKAKTGTGKTVAFLLPSIELVVKSPSISRGQKWPPIYVLVVCPTRELASQAAKEANTLLKYHPSVGVQVIIGGTKIGLEQKRMQTNPCQILVATPGRFMDHVENTSGFTTRLTGVKVLVLDEADQLLDMGFRKAIDKIIATVPKQRQTLLFSATVPQEVREICKSALKSDHEFINTVHEGSEDTHAQVRQSYLVAPLDQHFPLLYTMLKDHIADDVNYKVLVFCTTAMGTKLVAQLLGVLNLNVREIHSRKAQSARTKVSDEFRRSKGLILVTSDVSARGVDYPDVTLVIQIGVPSDKQQYIHRLGRTGRKGKEGLGILMLSPWEEYFLSSINDLPISKAPEPLVDPDSRKKVERALSQVEMQNKESAYQAWLGYYNSNKKIGRDKHKLVELANEFSRSMGLNTPPAIKRLVLGKMGLKNIPGLRAK